MKVGLSIEANRPVMVSCIRSLVICIIICALWTIPFLVAFPNSCINLPNQPLHGKFTITGQFIMRIKCLAPNTDLPMNAAGSGGVLICDPNGKDLTELPPLYDPPCLEYKKPKEVHIPVTLTYTSDTCDTANITSVENALSQLQSNNLKSLRTICGTQLTCFYTTADVECANNYNFIQQGGSKQIDATFKIHANYEQTLSNSFYLNVLKDIRKNMFATDQGISGTAQLWNIHGIQFVYADITAWTASCSGFNRTSGSNLAIHGIASCRGCPNHTLHYAGDRCDPCPFNHYTTTDFASKCVLCPPEYKWGASREKWIKICYERP